MPLLWVSAAFLAGLCLPLWFSVHWAVWAGLAGIFLAGSFLEKRLQKPAWLPAFRRFSRVTISLLLAALFAGAARYQLQQPVFNETDLAYYNDMEMELVGQVSDYPDVRDTAVQLTLEVSEIRLNGSTEPIPVDGSILARLPFSTEWQYGDVVRLEGELTTPSEEEEFSYRDYLETRGIYSTMYYPYASLVEHQTGKPVLKAIYRLRENANQTIQQILPQPEAGLLSGILLGLEHDIPADLDGAFQKTGTTHIIAISGFNIAILSGLFFSGASRLLPRFWAPLVSILAIALYAVMVGAQASVVRAAIMGGMALIGRQLGRQGAGVNSLSFTGAVMCLFNPFLIRDVGFQLSFMATLGLVLYAEPIHDKLQAWLENHFPQQTAHKIADLGSDYLLFTMAAQLTTLPLIVYHFGRFSFSSILANLLILPVQPLVMELGGVALISGMIWQPLGKALGWLIWPLPAYTNRMVSWLAAIPGGSIELGSTSQWLLVIFYLLLFGLTLDTGLRKYYPGLPDLIKKIRPSVVLVILMLLCAALWRSVASLPDGKLHIHVLNVPDGPAVLMQSPGGQTALINGGSSASRLSSELGQRVSLFNRQLDAVLVTDRKSKPLAGLPISIERFPARMVLWNTDAAALRNGKQLAETLVQQNVKPAWLETAQILDMGDGASLRVLQHDASGTALMVEWNHFLILIPGGVSPKILETSGEANLSAVDAILLAEEDLKETGAAEWENFQSVLIIWCGAENPQVTANDPHWIHLDEHSYIEVISDGATMWANSGD